MKDSDFFALPIARLMLIGRLVEHVVLIAIRTFEGGAGWEGKEGAAFCLFNPAALQPLLRIHVGSIVPGKMAKYYSLALEKAERVSRHAPDRAKCLSSFQTRDDSREKYPGSVLGNLHAWSISGFPGLGDEAISLVDALFAGDMKLSLAYEIAGISENPYFEALLSSMRNHFQNEQMRSLVFGSTEPIRLAA